MVDENESKRGIACMARICCPVRMCHPIPASPNRRTDSGVNTSAHSSATKIKSAAEGMATRTQAGGAAVIPVVFPVSVELLESSGIALNLIEVGHTTAT